MRCLFLKALDAETKGDASLKFQQVLPAFDRLNRLLEDHEIHEPWWLSELPPNLIAVQSTEQILDQDETGPPSTDGEPDPVHFPSEWREDAVTAILDGLSADRVGSREQVHALREAVDILREAIHQWAERYQLHRVEWLSDHLCLALQIHRSQQGGMGPDSFKVGLHVPFLRYRRPRRKGERPEVGQYRERPLPSPPEYQPERETREDWSKRSEAYADAVEARYREKGWEPVQTTPEVETHLLWLVRRQCFSTAYSRCGTRDVNYMRQRIGELADQLPIDLLRIAPRGGGRN